MISNVMHGRVALKLGFLVIYCHTSFVEVIFAGWGRNLAATWLEIWWCCLNQLKLITRSHVIFLFQGTRDLAWPAILWDDRHVVIGLCSSRTLPRLAPISRIIGVWPDTIHLTDTGLAFRNNVEQSNQDPEVLQPSSSWWWLYILAAKSK